jgi:hypothetical protein
MYQAYFTRRLLEALDLAEQAGDTEERSLHLRTSRYYRDLLDHGEKRHSFRHPSRIGAALHHVGSRPWRVIVSDLSTSGFRMTLEERVKPGRIVSLEMDGFASLDAFVVWQKADQVGCKFLSELHPALVDAALAISSPV